MKVHHQSVDIFIIIKNNMNKELGITIFGSNVTPTE
jgi:hypothetical protein